MSTVDTDIQTLHAALQHTVADHYRSKSQSADENGRIERGRAIALRGGVRRNGADWYVSSDTGTVEEYRVVDGKCPCKYNTFHTGTCKHRYAIAITLQASKQLDTALQTARYARYNDVAGIIWLASRADETLYFLALEGADAGQVSLLNLNDISDTLAVLSKVTDLVAQEKEAA